MPGVTIEVRRDLGPEGERALVAAVARAICAAFQIAESTLALRLVVHEPHRFALPRDKDERFTLVTIDCFQGRSIDELKTAMADSIEVYLEYCAKKGREPGKPFSGNFNVRLQPEVHQRIAMMAARDGVSLNKWVAKTLEKAVKR